MNKVFVGSLSWNVDEQELGNFFSQVGDVEEAKVIVDRETGRSRGFGFVTFVDPECAQKAIEEFDGAELDGRTIAVKIANQKREGGGAPSAGSPSSPSAPRRAGNSFRGGNGGSGGNGGNGNRRW